ncbi:hypothetical protein LTR56_027353 [Elasticomyces elasticus]|nr:hypothetical protein LTR56_027353 [Elasticomyces elasticus]KAK3615445.1 hypothetical protein LTR22_027436 [Elasticomyces elasticus]KAK4897273.1 hypothetical protein LTR49_028004 [Elasticomyces elasticus]KAK5736580.1 hypothetical protein LTS12_026143 [Elasticomyces elasticus]
MSGLVRLVAITGGVKALDQRNPVLSRILAWADLSFSCTWSFEPHLGCLYSWPYNDDHGDIDNQADPDWITFRNGLSNFIGLDLLETVNMLHAMPVELPSEESTEFDRQQMSKAIYVLERTLLHQLNGRREPITPPAFVLFNYTGLMFISLALRDLPVGAVRLQTVAGMLRVEIAKAMAAQKLSHMSHSTLVLLLWACTVHLATALRGELDQFILVFFEEISATLRISSLPQLKKTLRMIAWPEGYMEDMLAKVV